MKRGDDVFLFTLIDFLIQILFFGLAFYTIVTFINAQRDPKATSDKIDHTKVVQVTNWTGFSSIPKLAEFLNPIQKPAGFSEWAKFMSGHDLKDVELKLRFIDDHGGMAKIGQDIRAVGLPSCLEGDKATNGTTAVATFRLTDNRIDLLSETPNFHKVLSEINLSRAAVQSLTLMQFRELFGPLKAKHRQCRYFVSTDETQTLLHAPRDAVNSAFRIRSR